MKRTQNGITLVALVITIIILLILAGISISALSGSGLFAKAQQAQNATENAQAEENATLGEYEQWMANYTGGSSSGGSSSGGSSSGGSSSGGSSSGGSSSGGGTTYTAYVVGYEVELKSDSTEHFYVIKASGENEEKVTLLAAKNIDTSSLTQGDSAGTVAFCTDPDETWEGYWTSISGITYPYDLNKVESERATAINYAKAYGTKYGAEGRLMTVGEVKDITGLTGAGKISSPDWIKTTNYWLGSASNINNVWGVDGGGLYDFYYGSDSYYGVRPVIEISKSLIQ